MKKSMAFLTSMVTLALAFMSSTAFAMASAANDIVTGHMVALGAILYLTPQEEELIQTVKSLGEAQTKLKSTTEDVKNWMIKADNELNDSKKISAETKAIIEDLSKKAIELTDKCLEIEQKLSMRSTDTDRATKSFGEQFLESDAWLSMVKSRSGSARMEIKTAIINATGQNQPLVPADRVQGIITNPNRVFTIRDLLPVGPTASNLIEYTKENVFTNNAGPQYASPAYENVTKPESGITFTLATQAVATLAHWIPVSKQVLDDAPMLQSFIEGRLMYGLKLEEEDQLLNGNGLTGNLSGLLKSGNNVAYNRAVTGDTNIDALRRAITQGALSEYMMEAIVLNPADWEEIELTKSTQGEYILANPLALAGPTLWGKRVVPTNSIAAGTFLVGNFSMGAQIWDRQQAAVMASLENSDNFVKNMVTLLAEERLALTVYRPAAFVKGTF